jgi:hypothetical protein
MIKNDKNIFLYWDNGEDKIPIIHKMNIDNIRKRLENTSWNIVVTSLDKTSKYYIENLISLPDYFFDMKKRINDLSTLGGNQSDIIRLRLLEKYGGVYFDTSTILLKNSIESIELYEEFIKLDKYKLAGYTNVTFTRKNDDGTNYFERAKDGIELGVLFAKKDSKIIKILNQEIDKYWNWKTKNKTYIDYPLFEKYKLTKVSFLNEYHIHYTLFHMIITRNKTLLNELVTQSIHMKNKENSKTDGPYAITDRFCRGKSCYDTANPKQLLKTFIKGDLEMFDSKITTLEDRINFISKMDLIVIPGYLRVELEKYFINIEDYKNIESIYKYTYKDLIPNSFDKFFI